MNFLGEHDIVHLLWLLLFHYDAKASFCNLYVHHSNTVNFVTSLLEQYVITI